MLRYTRSTGPLKPQQEEVFKKENLDRADSPVWREVRVLVAAKLYGAGNLSSERAAKMAGIPHVEFLMSLGFYKVFLLQFELDELEQSHD